MSSDSRVRNRISPIQTKSGSAVSVHDDAEPQIVTAIASPAGRDENSSMPIHATPASASPIQTPLPSRTNSETTRSVVISASMHGRPLIRCAALRRLAPVRGVPCSSQHEFVGERDQQDDVPAAIVSCGIHSGVASLPVEMSLNCHDCKARRTL